MRVIQPNHTHTIVSPSGCNSLWWATVTTPINPHACDPTPPHAHRIVSFWWHTRDWISPPSLKNDNDTSYLTRSDTHIFHHNHYHHTHTNKPNNLRISSFQLFNHIYPYVSSLLISLTYISSQSNYPPDSLPFPSIHFTTHVAPTTFHTPYISMISNTPFPNLIHVLLSLILIPLPVIHIMRVVCLSHVWTTYHDSPPTPYNTCNANRHSVQS